MQTNPTQPIQLGVDRAELDRQIAELQRDVASEAERDLHFPTAGRSLANADSECRRCSLAHNGNACRRSCSSRCAAATEPHWGQKGRPAGAALTGLAFRIYG